MGRPPLETPKSLPVSLRLPPEVKKAAENAARADVRSLSSYLEKVLTDHLIDQGWLNEYGLHYIGRTSPRPTQRDGESSKPNPKKKGDR